MSFWASQVKKPNACQCRRHRDAVPVAGWGRPPGGGPGNALRILAWRSPWTEEPRNLQSTGSQIIRHNRSNLARMHRSFYGLIAHFFLVLKNIPYFCIHYTTEKHFGCPQLLIKLLCVHRFSTPLGKYQGVL